MRKFNLRTLILIVTASILLSISTVYAETVWSDDFNDNNADGWIMEKLDWAIVDPFTGEAVEFDTSAGTLKSPGDTPGNIWYLATHECNIDYGTWSFDVNIVDTPWEHFYVFLMTDDWAEYPDKAYSYDLVFSTEAGYPEPDSKGAIALFKRNGYKVFWYTIGEWSTAEEIIGWHHIDVTRNPDGVFDVYLNTQPIMHVEDYDPIFGEFSTFRFEASSGPEIDNVVVLDTYEVAMFELSNLVVEPDSVDKGKDVTVSVECTNVGFGSGSYSVVLKINGEEKDAKSVSLDAGDSTTVTFQAPTTSVGSYSVEIEGLTGSYEVKDVIPGFSVGSILAGLAVVLLVLRVRQRTN